MQKNKIILIIILKNLYVSKFSLHEFDKEGIHISNNFNQKIY